MRIVRFRSRPRAPLSWGWVDDDHVGLTDGSPFQEFRREKAPFPLASVELGPPVQPGKIICIGRNYPAHAAEHGAEVPSLPLVFLKPPSAVIGPGAAILLPPQSSRVEHEAELAVGIGEGGRGRHAGTARAPRDSIRFARWARGSTPTSPPPTCSSRARSTARCARWARPATWFSPSASLWPTSRS